VRRRFLASRYKIQRYHDAFTRVFRACSPLRYRVFRRFGMRQFMAVVLLLLFTVQSSGVSLASNVAVPNLDIVSSVRKFFDTTYVGAVLGVQQSRWQAMHARRPDFPKGPPPKIVPPDRHVNETRQFHYGVLRKGPNMLARPLSPTEAPKDPRAGAYGSASATSIRRVCSKNVGTVCSSTMRRTGSVLRSMAITPTVQPFLYEADTATAPTTPFNTTHETGTISLTMDSAPPHTAVSETVTENYNSGMVSGSFGWISPANVPNSTSWPAQTYTVTLNVTAANPNLAISSVGIKRVSSSGSVLATVGKYESTPYYLSSTGVLTFSITGTAQTANATDRLCVYMNVINTVTTAQSFSFRAGQNSGSGLNLGSAPALGTSTTGVNPWWTYEDGALPGHGRYMVNVGNGNLLVQADDADVHERGVDLAFQRTYNSQSTHDANNTDGSVPANYGDGWTNTFDAHLAYDGANTISVYDIDGTRYDYTADGNGNWAPPAGQYGKLTWDGACGYEWTKKTGTIYYFYSPDLNEITGCSETYPQDAAYGGRLYQIIGRNHNNSITLTYSWVGGNATSAANLAQINATHADGQALILKFGAAVSGGPTELLSITRPDNVVINYYYDTSGENLQWADLPGNNAAATIKESYGYNAGHQLWYATSPRYNLSSSDGDVTYFAYDSSNRLTQTYDWGLVNFEPDDGTSTYLQAPAPASTPLQTWRTITFSGYGSGATAMSDTDGHATTWTVDALGRVTQTQQYTGEANPASLITSQTWDAANNLRTTVDARGYTTDYEYDASGNLTAMALPSITTSAGALRPTTLVSYDQYNNILAYCDPAESNALGKNWTGDPGQSDSFCPTSNIGTLRIAWAYPAYEPYGELSTATAPATAAAPNGYQVAFAYDPTLQSGTDFGLITSTTGTSFTQNDGTIRTPKATFSYDGFGNQTSANSGNGAWTYSYDSLNRQVQSADPDSGNPTTCVWYYADGSIKAHETPAERGAVTTSGQCAASGSPDATAATFSYDADGDDVAEVDHYGCSSGQTCPDGTSRMWFDGEDRIVEVQQPHDTRADSQNVSYDYFGYGPATRYLYDLSKGNGSQFGSSIVHAYGNLFDVQRYTGTSTQTGSWMDVSGTAFDGLDRVTSELSYAVCVSTLTTSSSNTPETCSAQLQTRTNAYDSSQQSYGYLSSGIYENGSANFTYDNDGNILTNSALGATYTYDPDGRVYSVADANGTQAVELPPNFRSGRLT
jgi:YD repeat-containing protein